MDQALTQYALNAAWQLPVLAAGGWLLIRMAKPGPVAQHRIWVAVLALAVVLPAVGLLTPAAAHVAVVPPSTPAAQAPPAGIAAQNPAAQAAALSATHAPHTQWFAQAESIFASLHFTRRIQIGTRTAQCFTAAFLLVLILGLMRLLRAWGGARQLVARSLDTPLTPQERALLTECARTMGVQPPKVRIAHHADALPGPAIVGTTQPVLLCPNGFLRQLLDAGREDEATAALCHEMAHIRRHDYAVNLICEAMAVPLRWHPATYGVTRQIHQTREMACDGSAACAMESQADYARCLVSLAEQMSTGAMAAQPGAIGLFHGNTLEERVMQLIDKQTPISTWARVARGTAGAAAITAAVALAAMVHVVPASAQAVPTIAPVSQAIPAPPTPAQPPVVAAAKPPVAPVARPNPAVPPQTQPAPAARPAPGKQESHHSKIIESQDGKFYAFSDGHLRQLTPAERARLQKQLEETKKKIAAAEARINSPEFRERLAKAQRAAHINMARIQEHLAVVQKRLNSPEFKAKIAEAQKQAEEAAATLQSPEFRKQMKQAQQEAKQAALNSAKIQRQLAEAQKQLSQAMARIKSQAFQKQLAEANHQAMEAQRKLASGEIQKQMENEQKKLQKQIDELKRQQMKSNKPDSPQP